MSRRYNLERCLYCIGKEVERCIREEVKAWGILAGIYYYIYCKDGGYVLVSCTLVECHGIIVSVGCHKFPKPHAPSATPVKAQSQLSNP